MTSVGVIGGGAWGTALANLLAGNGVSVTLWVREPPMVEAINTRRTNPDFLPGIPVAEGVRATSELAEAARHAFVLLASPAQHLRAITSELAPALPAGARGVICAKGIEAASGALLTEVVAACAPKLALAVLSGPTFASEVAAGKPTAVTLACEDDEAGATLLALVGGRTFRPYLSRDLIGVQVGGAIKNVVAIAAGIVAGRNLGDNGRAALITRGLAEMLRFGRALGADDATLMGLSGLGDLVLTSTSVRSRNYALGVALGRGESLASHTQGRKSIAEGVATAAAVVRRAATLGVEMPISTAVDRVVNRGAPIDQTIAELLARPFKYEASDRRID